MIEMEPIINNNATAGAGKASDDVFLDVCNGGPVCGAANFNGTGSKPAVVDDRDYTKRNDAPAAAELAPLLPHGRSVEHDEVDNGSVPIDEKKPLLSYPVLDRCALDGKKTEKLVSDAPHDKDMVALISDLETDLTNLCDRVVSNAPTAEIKGPIYTLSDDTGVPKQSPSDEKV